MRPASVAQCRRDARASAATPGPIIKNSSSAQLQVCCNSERRAYSNHDTCIPISSEPLHFRLRHCAAEHLQMHIAMHVLAGPSPYWKHLLFRGG